MADDIIEGTHPTRMELLQIKNKLRLAEKGHRLLKEKRDTLVMEFMDIARKSEGVSESAVEQTRKARHAYAIANALAGSSQLMSAALASRGLGVEAEVEERNVMGISLPKISLDERLRQIDQRGYGLITTHPSIDAAAGEYEGLVEDMVRLAETEQSLLALSNEVRKTKRRVNALEYKVIPQLTNTRKYIQMRLEEMERAGFYARKMIKRKRASG
jgi:V/A-type H+-transporting ATPase subunit D